MPTSTSKVSLRPHSIKADTHEHLRRGTVAHKTRQFEEWLVDTLEDFRRHQESLISRMPRLVRNVTMREFAKYKGDIQAAVKGLSRELLGSEDATIDLTTRKRKWVESQEADGDKLGKEESSRGAKNGTRHWNASTWLVLTSVQPARSRLHPRRNLHPTSFHSQRKSPVFR